MKLSVHLVTWNGAKYVPYLFESLRKQTFKDWKLVILDNNSQDRMVEAMKNELNNPASSADKFPVEYQLIENEENKGFAGGHNQLFRQTDAEYFICLNQDMYLEPDCFEKLVHFMDNNPDVAVVSPRLMKWNFFLLSDESKGLDNVYSDQVDSLGMKVFRSRRVIEQYGQEDWEKIKNNFSSNLFEVFGVSGTLPLFRRSVINEVAFSDNTFFDESYHSYKEDVDLAFRLRSSGYKAYVLLDAVAYHDRSAAGPKELNDRSALKNKEKQSNWVKYHSYKNHLMTLYKNEYRENFLLDFPFIVWYELKKFGYFLIFDRSVLKGLGEMWKLRKPLKEKRGKIKEKRKVDWKEIRKWWK